MRNAIAALFVGLMSVGSAAAQPAGRPLLVRPAPVGDQSALALRPLPTIKAYYPETYRQIVAVVETAARTHQSNLEIAGAVGQKSNTLMADMAPYYDTTNTIEYMVVSRDVLVSMAREMPGECVEFMRPDGHLSSGARETLATILAKQPVWRQDMVEASLRQAASAPAKPPVGATNPIVARSIREIALQSVPAALRPFLHPIDPARPVSAQESEAACRYAGGIIAATLQLPPEQAAGTFKRLSAPTRGLLSASAMLPVEDAGHGPMAMAARYP